SLACATCDALAVSAPYPLVVSLAARNRRKVDEMCLVAGLRAALSARPVRFVGHAVDLDEPGPLAAICAATLPSVVLCCASVQSPWERLHAPSAWTALLARAGFGLAAPLHAVIASTVAAAVTAGSPHACYLNACYPDAVNPLLHALGTAIFCGTGNVALLSAAARSALRLTPTDRLRVLAHHRHLDAPETPTDEARMWLGPE